MPTNTDREKRRAELEAELRGLDAAAKCDDNWEHFLRGIDRRSREQLLRYLTAWRKQQPGHDVDCNCGECD